MHIVPVIENDTWCDETVEYITSLGKNVLGRVYVFYSLKEYANRQAYSDASTRVETDIRDSQRIEKLQSAEPKMRVEFFSVAFDGVKKNIEESLYHLASRVCGALVEYKRHPRRPVTRDGNRNNTKKTEDCTEHPLEALELVNGSGGISGLSNATDVVRKIYDLRDAMDLVCEGLDGSMNYFPPVPSGMQGIFMGEDNKNKVVATRYKFPFGVWFRGQPRVCLDLMPSLYHEKNWKPVHQGCSKMKCDQTMYDESTMVHHFMAHRATLRHDYNDVFEWLCLMQHYGAPSRVLDWTENILTALYFAVADTDADCDGAVWALNAGRLNEITRVSSSKRYVCLADSTDVVLRSAIALSRTGKELRRTLLKIGKLEEIQDAVHDPPFWKWTEGKRRGIPSKTLAKLACPVAVFPTRINERESMQLATFTIYGGKDYDKKVQQIEPWERFPDPKGLLWISRNLQSGNDDKSWDKGKKTWIPQGKPFLDVYVVPSCAKRKMREQLKRVGVHVGSLFPELEYQAKYIRHQWRFEYE